MSAVLNDLVNEKGSFKWKDEHQQVFADAKSLVLLFNKASRKPPPRIEIEIFGMQHLDFTLVYSPGEQSS